MNRIQQTYPAEISEKAMYLARKAYDNTIRFALLYPGKLSPEVMKMASTELVNRLDILHSSFTAGLYRASWTVNTDYTDEDIFTEQMVADNLLEAMHTAMAKPVPFGGKVQIHCTLLQDSRQSALVLTVGHMCADGSDAKYLLLKLIELYNCLQEEKDPAAVVLKNGCRSADQFTKQLTHQERRRLNHKPAIGTKSEFVFQDDTPGNVRILTDVLPAELITAARRKAKQYQGSVNDLLLTAFYRAVARKLELSDKTPLGIQTSIDLRRHLPGGDTAGVCNLAGSMSTSLENGIGGCFADTLQAVIDQTTKSKNDKLTGMYDLHMLRQVFRILPFAAVEKLGGKTYGNATIALTNLGALKEESLEMEHMIPSFAAFGAHVKPKPAFQIAAIGLSGAVTLCSAIVCTEADEQEIREVYSLIRGELKAFAENKEV